MGSLGVASCLDLASVTLGESNCKNAYKVTILGLGLDESLNKGVPLLDEGAKLVAGDVHSVEVGVAVETLDFFNLELDLSPCDFMGVVVEFTK